MPSTQYSDKYWNLNQNKHIVNPIVYTPKTESRTKEIETFLRDPSTSVWTQLLVSKCPKFIFSEVQRFCAASTKTHGKLSSMHRSPLRPGLFFAMIKPAWLGGCCGCWMLKNPFKKGTKMSKTLQNTGRHQQSSIRIRWHNVDNADVVDVFDSYLCAWR